MKKLLLLACAALIFTVHYNADAQGFLNKMKQKAQDKLNQKVDKKMDQALDSTDASVSSSNHKSNATAKSTSTSGNTSKRTIAAYKNYDFVPGDKIVFESQLDDERNGEIPSQFTLTKGQMDIQDEDGEKVIHIPQGQGATFEPRMKTANYVPEQFTIEFDFKNEKYGVNHVSVNFGYRVGTYGPDDTMQGVGFDDNRVNWKLGDVNYPEDLKNSIDKPMEWHHYAIAVNASAGKAYVDQFRVANLNNLTGKPKGIFIDVVGYENSYIKNIRIASGGIDFYKKVTTDNKIITHGILFDIDQATIQPSSMGTLNDIVYVLKRTPALKFEIDGHTDNTGTAGHNLTLSQQRAEAVKTQLVAMGIDASRLTAKGYGDTKPLGANATPEDRANNRRVEFVKL